VVDQICTGVSLRLLAHHLIEAGVRGPVVGSLSRGRDHPGYQDQHVDGNPGGYQRRGEPAEGLRGNDQAAAAAGRLDHGVGVLVQPGRVVVTGQVGRERVMAALPQFPLDQVPVPSDISAAVNQHEGGHRHLPPRGSSSLAGRHQHAKGLTQPGQRRDAAWAVQCGRTATSPAMRSKHDERHARLAGTTGKRPARPLVRDEEARARHVPDRAVNHGD
jgi:hypothetical protein